MSIISEAHAANPLPTDMPAVWRGEVQTQLHPEENVLAALEVDLDER